VGFVSLGCAKNLVDAEIMIGSLLAAGMEVVNDPAQADAIVVNTCAFIDAAQEESVDAILEAGAARDAKTRGQALIVSGCLSQRFREDLPTLFPEVDAFMGVDQITEVGKVVQEAFARRATTPAARPAKAKRASAVKRRIAALDAAKPEAHDHHEHAEAKPAVMSISLRPNYVPTWNTPRFQLTPKHFAYLKIAEGCNHPCSFCTIPKMRGAHRSRPLDDIVATARRMVAEGVRELNLISQDSTYYGLDLRPNHSRAIASPAKFTAASKEIAPGGATLATLLRALNDIPGEFWVRLLYTHPAHWTDDAIQAFADCPKVARYIDMPLQHIHDDLLVRMRRETDGAYIRDLIARLRKGIPGVALRTTFIVGFPGETESHFQTLLDFIRETRFDRVGVFAYSQEEGTVAGKMAGQVPPEVRQERRERAMAAQLEAAQAAGAARVGSTMKVLVEAEAREKDLAAAQVRSWEHRQFPRKGPKPPRGRYFVARGESDAPDIDGRVYVRGAAKAGEFATVKIVGSTDYDLVAEVVESKKARPAAKAAPTTKRPARRAAAR
jgi:ribosomal protein S12 methylthiotransferase